MGWMAWDQAASTGSTTPREAAEYSFHRDQTQSHASRPGNRCTGRGALLTGFVPHLWLGMFMVWRCAGACGLNDVERIARRLMLLFSLLSSLFSLLSSLFSL